MQMSQSDLFRDVMMHQEEMEAERALEEPNWRDLAQLFAPEQLGELSGSGRSRPEDFAEIVDATQLHAVEALSSGIFTDLTNPTNPWAAFTIEDQDLARFYPCKLWLEQVSAIVTGTLSPTRSKFYAQAPAWFADMAVFGFGTLATFERRDMRGFTDRVIPLHEMFLAHDHDDDLVRVHRRYVMTGRKARAAFPELSEKLDPKAKVTIIHAVFLNPRQMPGKPGSLGARWLSVYLCKEDKEFCRKGFFYDLPYHVLEWSRRASRSYATGPASRARADVASLQVMEEAHMTAANFAARPPILSASEELIAATDVMPGQWVSGAVSEGGKQLVQPLNLGGDIRLSAEMSKQKREHIREAFYFSAMMLVNRPQMTATEVLGYQEERMRAMAPNLTRIQVSGLSPLLFRRFEALARAGAIPEPPPELEGQALAMDYLSPMARIQKATRGRAVLNTFGAAVQLAQGGKPEVLDKIDGDATLDILHDSFGAEAAMLLPPAMVQQIRQARQQAQNQAAELEQTGQAVAIAAEASHAQQASTLASARGGA